MRVVVAGATGFIGRAFVKYLHDEGHTDVVSVVRSPRRQSSYPYIAGNLRESDFARSVCIGADMVFNLAAEVGGIGYISDHKVDCLLSSLINTNLLRACETHKVKRYFFASSSCVYPECNLPLREEDAYPAMPSAGYGWEKLFSEQMCSAFDEEKRVPCTVARFHTLYGPGDDRPPGREHVIEALCKKVIGANSPAAMRLTSGVTERRLAPCYISTTV
jgi:GDP-D-mannose 3',5'-epimerase